LILPRSGLCRKYTCEPPSSPQFRTVMDNMEMDNVGAHGGGTSSLKHGEEDHGEEEFGLPGGAMDGTSRNSRCVQSSLREEYTAASYAAYRMRLSGLAADSL
jgi:hypothetical protein